MKFEKTVINKKIISNYQFLSCLFAQLVLNGQSCVKRSELVKKLYDFKKNHSELIDIFLDFDFRKSLSSISSQGVADGLAGCLTFGLTYTKIPNDGFIYFDFDKNYAKTILKRLDNVEYEKAFKELSKNFID